MRKTLENTPNLSLRQGMVVDLLTPNNKVRGVVMQDGRRIGAKAVVIAAGTFLNGLIHTGRRTYSAGRTGEPASLELADALKRLGLPVGRLKTGTPPRLDGRTINWDAFESQQADERPVAFSFSTDKIEQPQIDCYIGYTTGQLHEAIRKNLHQSPLYSGQIKGVGPRYCPSIEDKVVKFAGKDRHQLFLEPEGHDTNEVYLNGFSTSLPAGLQQELVRMIPGLESANIVRPGYAIEYDYVDPRELGPDLQVQRIAGLFHAGQINGTTGYEEAGCQGLLAGINAARLAQGRPRFSLRREESYIGVLVDDLITQGVDEPYRIFTSRAEYRLAFRHDNADERLSKYGREVGLVGDREWERFNQRRDRIAKIKSALRTTRIRKSDAAYLALAEKTGLNGVDSISLEELAKRSGVTPAIISELLPWETRSGGSLEEIEFALSDNLYSGYIRSQENVINRLHGHDTVPIPTGLDFRTVNGLSHEMAERLERAKPLTFGAARRIPGLTPAALTTLLVNVSVSA
jgi:tRNA uridine 5-carboxymethylaminomethyl modification enzyme